MAIGVSCPIVHPHGPHPWGTRHLYRCPGIGKEADITEEENAR